MRLLWVHLSVHVVKLAPFNHSLDLLKGPVNLFALDYQWRCDLARYGIEARTENVLITSGSQQALDLIGKLFINPGDRVLVEARTYLGALQAFNVYGSRNVSVPIDEDGVTYRLA